MFKVRFKNFKEGTLTGITLEIGEWNIPLKYIKHPKENSRIDNLRLKCPVSKKIPEESCSRFNIINSINAKFSGDSKNNHSDSSSQKNSAYTRHCDSKPGLNHEIF